MATAAPPDVAGVSLMPVGFHNLRVADLRPHPSNIRKNLGDLTELAGSIASKGVLEPLLVVPEGFVVCGHRRLAAAIQVGEQRVPCVVRELTAQEAIEAMLVENLQRSDLTPLEEANAYQELLNLGESADEIAAAVSVNADRIRRRAALLKLPNAARELLESHRITIGAAEELLQLKGHPEEINHLIDRAGFKAGEVRDTPLASFSWQLTEAKNRIKIAESRAASIAKAEKAGLKVVPLPKFNDKAKRIGTGYADVNTPLAAHRSLACHAVAIGDNGKLVAVCTKPKNHPEATKEAETAERKPGRDYEAERQEAERRHALLIGLLRSYVDAHPSGSAEVHALAVMTLREGSYADAADTICEILGIDFTKGFGNSDKVFVEWLMRDATVIRGAMPVPELARLQKARLAIDLAQLDECYAQNEGSSNDQNAWLLFLRGLGYELDDEDLRVFSVDDVLAWSDKPASAFLIRAN